MEGVEAVLARIGGMKTLVYGTLALVAGALLGLVVFTFGYAKGYAYFSHDSAACVQCHSMNEQYNAWKAGPHHAVAQCADCHMPHDNIVHQMWVKGEDGFLHSLKFTTGDYPENIQIRPQNYRVAQESCLHCHGNLTEDMEMTRTHSTSVDCLHCHSEVGHAR